MGEIYASFTLQLAAASRIENDLGMNIALPVMALPDHRVYGFASAVGHRQTKLVATMYSSKKEFARTKSLLTASPLRSRGWVLQETQLAPRTVHFTDEFIYWECLERVISQQGLLHQDFRFMSTATFSPRVKISCGTKLDDWYELVMNYSKRKLSFSKKKKGSSNVRIDSALRNFERR